MIADDDKALEMAEYLRELFSIAPMNDDNKKRLEPMTKNALRTGASRGNIAFRSNARMVLHGNLFIGYTDTPVARTIYTTIALTSVCGQLAQAWRIAGRTRSVWGRALAPEMYGSLFFQKDLVADVDY
jgi:hypothetical protein